MSWVGCQNNPIDVNFYLQKSLEIFWEKSALYLLSKTLSQGCINGGCKAPDHCACQIGWEGHDCSVCIKNPACQNGYCDEPFQCKCSSGWTGSQCEIGNKHL